MTVFVTVNLLSGSVEKMYLYKGINFKFKAKE